MTERIRILAVDDHAVVREGLRALIELQPDMELVGEAEDGVEAVARALSLNPDVVLMDLVMPRMSGIEAISEIRRHRPGMRILVLTSFSDNEKVFPAIRAGALGYLLKDSSPQELLQGIRDVFGGASSMHPTIARSLIRELQKPAELPPTGDPLTERETEVLVLLARGWPNQRIADELCVSLSTVRTHVTSILSKLHLANRTQAALYALRKGLVDLDDA
ncbi:MAG: response regulator transcription factor [Chloroflexi bacterium]|nr:response regulator transcription factor [Chloroflexota bacterium]